MGDEDRAARMAYHRTISRLIELAEKDMTATEASELAKIKEDHSWDGLSCYCGGGWMVGHRDGCPEAMSEAS